MTPLGELRDAREQLIEVQDGRDLAADLGERFERLGVEPALLEEPRVDERDGDVRGELAQDGDVVAAELIAVAAEEVERADRLRLVQQRHDDLRGHAGHELDVARIGREVVDEERLLARDRGADQPLTELQPERLVAVADSRPSTRPSARRAARRAGRPRTPRTRSAGR